MLSGRSLESICEILGLKRVPKELLTYMFCSPGLDGTLRCLPRSGGYLDQDYIDMLNFSIIESRIGNWQSRQILKNKNKSKVKTQQPKLIMPSGRRH